MPFCSFYDAPMSRPPWMKKPKPPQPRKIPPPQGQQTLSGILKRFSYSSPETGYRVARLTAQKDGGGIRTGEEIVAVGHLPGIEAGASVELTGQWSQHPQFGWQFALEGCRVLPPSSKAGIEAFLGSGLIAGIGEEYARRIVQQFGEETLEVLREEPKRLFEVEGIGPKRFERIQEGWKTHESLADIMSFLQSFGISTNWALKIYRQYGNQAVPILQQNPYRLAIDMRGIGFHSADRIAQEAGIAPDSDARVEAAVLHVLREAAGKGHVFYPFDTLSEEALELLKQDDPQRIRTAVATLCKDDLDNPPLVAEKLPEGDKAVYLRGLHFAETNVAAYLKSLAQTGKNLPRFNTNAVLEAFAQKGGPPLADRQKEAVASALKGGVSILTGGPGTGKTTTLRVIMEALKEKKVPFALAAPTGRAAKRMSESCRHDASTIHRLLQYDPQKGGFRYNESLPLPVDYVVVDEASMLDTALFHQLLKALSPTASLLLVGDVDQLPSVGAGNVLRDLIDSAILPVVRLDTIFRQARRSLIVVNAHRINHGEFPCLKPPDGGKGDFYFVEREDPEEALEAIISLVTERIPKKYPFNPLEDIQVITPMHRGVLGAQKINTLLQERLNTHPKRIERGGGCFKVNDKVMQMENNYDKDVFNGDVGIITALEPVDHIARVRYGRRIVEYKYTELDQLRLSYATTVHKSQGSEYPVVVLPVHTQHYIMLQRNLLYTAITRGRKLVVVVGTKKAIHLAIANDRQEVRNTGLRQRLQQG